MSNNNILNLKCELIHFLEKEVPKSKISTDGRRCFWLKNEKLEICLCFDKNGKLYVFDNKVKKGSVKVFEGSLNKFKQRVVKNKFGWKEDKKHLKANKKLISKIAKWIYNVGIDFSTYGNWKTDFNEIANKFNSTYDEAISMSNFIYAEVYKYKGVCAIEMYEEDNILLIDVIYFTDYLKKYGDDD